MTSVLIIVEMTGGYSLILPLMLANMTAYVLARRLRPIPIYEALLGQDGVHLQGTGTTDQVEGLRVRQFVRGDAPLRTFRLDAHAEDVVKRGGEEPGQLVYPVVDELQRIVGIVTSDDIAIVSAEPDLLPLVNASDMMRPTVSVDLDDDLGFALQTMISNALSQLPITDKAGRCVGFVTEADIAKAYLRVPRPRSRPDVGQEGP
jgi:CIC family chloride channel protein